MFGNRVDEAQKEAGEFQKASGMESKRRSSA